MFDTIITWLYDPQSLGTIPAWFGGLSLVLAVVLFTRDRRRDDRAQIDKIALWPIPEWNKTVSPLPPADRDDEAQIQVHAKNSSDLPIQISAVSVGVRSRWDVSTGDGAWVAVPSEHPPESIFAYDILFTPGFDQVISDYRMSLAQQAPENGVRLSFDRGVVARVQWFLAIDNAGRRWEVRPGRGGRARRIRWCSRTREYYPIDWQNPLLHPLFMWLDKTRKAAWAIWWPRRARSAI